MTQTGSFLLSITCLSCVNLFKGGCGCVGMDRCVGMDGWRGGEVEGGIKDKRPADGH